MTMSARLYGNLSLMGLNGLTYSKIASVQSAVKDRISYNVVQSVIDTITAKIAKNKPKPYFLTSGGDYQTQRKAKKLNKFIEGIFHENKMYDLGTMTFRDGAVWGDGIVHVFDKAGRVTVERVHPTEIWVDDIEGFYGEPRQLHRTKNVDRQVLLAAFPKYRKEIETANAVRADDTGSYPNIADMITIRESWHLPSKEEGKDGRHMITIQTAVLLDEPWTKPFFPFARFQWCQRLYGYWGQGLAEQIQNLQLEINKLLWVIQRSFHLAGTFKVFLENGSKIVKEHLSNDIGAIVNYTGTPPQYVTPQIVPPEIFQHLMTLKSAAFEQAGISQLSAASLKPAGLNSGKALREYNDIESDRFMTIGQAYEQFYIDVARLAVSVVKDIVEEQGNYEVSVPGKKFLDTVDWKAIDLEDDQYVMQCYPVSSLPQDPAGRLQTVTEYIQAGFLSPRQGKRLLDFPDLEKVEGLANAEEDYVARILDGIVDEGEYRAPEPFDDLQLCREMALEYYAQGKCNGLEEARLELLRRFIDQVDTLLAAAVAPMAEAAAAGQVPQASPQPPPQSELVQNVPGMSPGLPQ
jgi:hypothetical protein